MKARGVHVAGPTLPFTQDPAVDVQLKSSTGVCWGATYTSPAARSDAAQFEDDVD